MKKFLCSILIGTLALSCILLGGCSKKTAAPLPFTGTDYTIPELDLSQKPENIYLLKTHTPCRYRCFNCRIVICSINILDICLYAFSIVICNIN